MRSRAVVDLGGVIVDMRGRTCRGVGWGRGRQWGWRGERPRRLIGGIGGTYAEAVEVVVSPGGNVVEFRDGSGGRGDAFGDGG